MHIKSMKIHEWHLDTEGEILITQSKVRGPAASKISLETIGKHLRR